MNPIRPRVGILAGLAGALLAALAGAPAALASPPPRPPGWNKHPPLPASPPPAPGFPPGWNKHPPLPAHAHALATGGMPGWQIALIAVAAVLLAAGLAVLTYRALAARRRTTASTA